MQRLESLLPASLSRRHRTFEIEVGVRPPTRQTIFEVFQDIELLTGERRFETVRRTNEKLGLIACGRARDDTHRAAGMHQRVVRSPHFDQRNDLRSGKDVVRLVRHYRAILTD